MGLKRKKNPYMTWDYFGATDFWSASIQMVPSLLLLLLGSGLYLKIKPLAMSCLLCLCW